MVAALTFRHISPLGYRPILVRTPSSTSLARHKIHNCKLGPTDPTHVHQLRRRLKIAAAGSEITADFFRRWPANALTKPSPSLQKLITAVAFELDCAAALGLTDKSQTVQSIDLNNESMLRVLTTIEQRRRVASQLAWEQTRLFLSTSFDHLELLNPAERYWMEHYAFRLAEIANAIFGRQSSLDFEEMALYILREGTIFDRQHFARIQESTIPRIQPKFIPEGLGFDPNQYKYSLPWMPEYPLQSAMWPQDMDMQELNELRALFPAKDPIFFPFTVVERIQPGTRLPNDRPDLSWIRKAGKAVYLVTPLPLHPRFKPLFRKAAKLLKESANLEIEGSTLDPTFKSYLLTMADCFRTGKLWELLQAELHQLEGGINLTFFPHEGYWRDNIKFPMMYGSGIRDWTLLPFLAELLPVMEQVETETIDKARAFGLQVGSSGAAAFNPKMAFALLYITAFGGFARARANGDVGGHDIPKKTAPTGTQGHRYITILDVIEVADTMSSRPAVAELIPDQAGHLSIIASKQLVALHEAGHGLLANLPDSPTVTGKPLGEVFADFWGILVEPHADCNAVAVICKLFREGKITAGEYNHYLINFMAGFILCKLKYPLAGLGLGDSPSPQELVGVDDPHLVGNYMQFGWLCRKGIFVLSNGKIEIDWERVFPAFEELFSILTDFGLRGNLAGYQAFVASCFDNIDRDLLAHINAVHRQHSFPKLVYRGDFPLIAPATVTEVHL